SSTPSIPKPPSVQNPSPLIFRSTRLYAAGEDIVPALSKPHLPFAICRRRRMERATDSADNDNDEHHSARIPRERENDHRQAVGRAVVAEVRRYGRAGGARRGRPDDS